LEDEIGGSEENARDEWRAIRSLTRGGRGRDDGVTTVGNGKSGTCVRSHRAAALEGSVGRAAFALGAHRHAAIVRAPVQAVVVRKAWRVLDAVRPGARTKAVLERSMRRCAIFCHRLRAHRVMAR